jgi:DNA-binding GntR family transcriptional regulator
MEMTMQQFNVADRRIDQLFLTAAHQPFVEGSLRPLHTIFRRVSWIYHMHMANNVRLKVAVDLHIAVIDGVANGDVDAAISASERLMDFVDGMLDVLEREVAPTLLDCSLDSFDDPVMILNT